MKKFQKLSIIVPVYNEEKTIENVLERLIKNKLINNIEKEIVIIDDCSSDNTSYIVRAFIQIHLDKDIKLFHHAVNQGRGAALHSGIRNTSGDYIMIQDTNLEYNSEEFNSLINKVFTDNDDVVYGSRVVDNKFLNLLCNKVTNLNLADIHTSYKLFRSDIIRSLDLKEQRFGFDSEVTIKLSKIPNIKMSKVDFSYFGQTYSQGKKINFRDGVRAIYCIIKYGLF